jgi:hypothetical protein
MKRVIAAGLIIVVISLIGACSLPGGGKATETPPVSVSTIVALTLTAFSNQNTQTSPRATETPAIPTATTEPTITFTPTIILEPSRTFTLTQTTMPTKTPIPDPGSIEGYISNYPYGAVPSLQVVAREQEPPFNYSYWITAPGDTYFSMTSQYLLPGKYQVVAYDSDGHAGGCTTIVTVKSNQTSSCNITDWSGSYPPKP